MLDKDNHFGEHLTIDGYNGNYELLSNRELLLEVLSELPKILGMHQISEPQALEVPGNNLKDPGGVSGFVMIAESHISVHTFPKRGFVSIDVYTCQNGLDVEAIKNYFTRQFELQELEVNFILRGKKYPGSNIY